VALVSRVLRAHGYGAAVALVTLATVCFLPLRPWVDFAHLAWLYLIVVGLVAWSSGTRPALLAAALSFVAGNYFFTRPFGTLSVTQPLDLIQLVVFLVGAGVVGALTGRVRERELAAVSSEREATALARLASEMARGRDLHSIVQSAASCLMSLPDVESVIVWLDDGDAGLVAWGRDARLASSADREVARRSFDRVKAVNLTSGPPAHDRLGSGWPAVEADASVKNSGAFVPIVSPEGNEGVLQVICGSAGISADTSSLAVSISHLLAVFLSGMRAADTAARVQGAQEAARVKSLIVSAVSHELKTPLSAAVAAVTDLLDEGVTRDAAAERTALVGVVEDLERLESAIADLLDLSRLQAEEWMPHPERYEAGEIFGDVVSRLPESVRSRLRYQVEEPTPSVFADFAQVSRALHAVLDNAVVYSPADSPILLGASSADDRTLLWVEDRGPGVEDDDKPFIFDQAYRGSAGARRPGSTGLGLTIAHDLIEANAGHMRVEDARPNGTRLVADLPARERPEA